MLDVALLRTQPEVLAEAFARRKLEVDLDALRDLDERQARVAELRFFAGLRVPEAAAALGVSTRTVEGDWAHARAWLRRELAS